MEYTGNDFYCDVALKDTSMLKKEYDSENILAYHHTRPSWPVHIVIVPKKHISSFTNREKGDDVIISEMLEVIRTIAKKVEKEEGAARILTNLGKYQDSKHLHFHVSSGDALR
ncbi:HIT domain-containing protein [Candidatus Jorgensenbacteria bacterium]|nr:HIT domain-containing protein [Candidatus Jorgensenbacteria bacterium]